MGIPNRQFYTRDSGARYGRRAAKIASFFTPACERAFARFKNHAAPSGTREKNTVRTAKVREKDMKEQARCIREENVCLAELDKIASLLIKRRVVGRASLEPAVKHSRLPRLAFSLHIRIFQNVFAQHWRYYYWRHNISSIIAYTFSINRHQIAKTHQRGD